MANANRYRRGPRQLIQVPIASATVVEKGDLVVLSSGKATTPSLLLASGSETATAALARNAVQGVFMGVAENASAAGDTDDILVDISLEAIFEFNQATAAAISVGDLLGAAASSTASASYTASDDTVEADTSNPIAVCVKEHTAAEGAGTKVKLVPQKLFNSTSWM